MARNRPSDADDEPQAGTTRRAGLRPDERDPNDPERFAPGSAGGETNMAGTPGGGLAAGGLGGTNAGDGAQGNANLDEAYGVGIHDNLEDEEDVNEPLSGRSGGAVGGTPAGKRASGGRAYGISGGNDSGADPTIGADPHKPR